jgi:hypothetical protein
MVADLVGEFLGETVNEWAERINENQCVAAMSGAKKQSPLCRQGLKTPWLEKIKPLRGWSSP